MDFTRPAGRALSVGELRAALADLDERTPIKLDINDAQVGVAEVVTSRFFVEIVADSLALDTDALNLLVEIVEGTIPTKNVKVEAGLILAAAGIQVGKEVSK